jgi:hypothetical protein
MRKLRYLLATMALIVGIAAGSASPVTAAPADPAVTYCSFTPIYRNYQNGGLSYIIRYYPRGTALTVTSGDGNAWFVTVNRDGQQGWMDNDCIRFLA